jgi:endonuclease/exonuclease/phosphatase family metal-dependent hydrolase
MKAMSFNSHRSIKYVSRAAPRTLGFLGCIAAIHVLSLAVCVAAPRDVSVVKVMTQNMDSGTDLGLLIAFGAPEGVDFTLAEIQASHIPERANLVAQQIAAEQPDIVALEEATLWRVGPTPETSTQILYDQLQLLLSALDAHGAAYRVLAVNSLTDLALPGTTGAVRYTDRDAILVRSDVGPPALHFSDVDTHLYKAAFNFQGVIISQGWISVDVHMGNKHFRLAETHLESPVPGVPESTEVQLAQAAELVQSLRNLPHPVVICGDFNSDANFGQGPDGTPSVALIEAAGYADSWLLANPKDPGPTWPLFLEDQAPPDFYAPAVPFERIDLFFSRGLKIINATEVFANAPRATVPALGSDHAGVITTLRP